MRVHFARERLVDFSPSFCLVYRSKVEVKVLDHLFKVILLVLGHLFGADKLPLELLR